MSVKQNNNKKKQMEKYTVIWTVTISITLPLYNISVD